MEKKETPQRNLRRFFVVGREPQKGTFRFAERNASFNFSGAFRFADYKLLIKLIPEEPSLSRLVITKDFRIVLPDYQNMEIKMEPLNKAVYLLFLKHPEGIIFKHLTDYRKELIEIYTQLRPLGMTERAMHSIEDVTNPTLNSINEKCARIRGAFISKFDENLAKNYFITGRRGEAKKILLPRELVEWEEEI